MVHTSMRRAFFKSVGVPIVDIENRDEAAQTEALLLEQIAQGQTVVLTPLIAKEYRKNITVHAFEVDSPMKVFKSWGLSEGKANDWVVCGKNGDVYMNSAEEFLRNYEKVGPAQPHVFRKVLIESHHSRLSITSVIQFASSN